MNQDLKGTRVFRGRLRFGVWLATAIAVIACGILPLHAASIGVDIGSGSSSFPTNWNQTTGNLSNLIDESGATTVIDFSYSAGEITNQVINAGTLPNHSPSLAGLDDLDAKATSAAFTSLVPNALYNLWVFSLYDGYLGTSIFDVSVNGSYAFTQSVTVVGDLVINGQTGSNANSLAFYAFPVTANGSGELNLSFGNPTGSGGEIAIAGFAIEQVGGEVPEPSSLFLLGSGLLLFGWRVRRRRTT